MMTDYFDFVREARAMSPRHVYYDTPTPLHRNDPYELSIVDKILVQFYNCEWVLEERYIAKSTTDYFDLIKVATITPQFDLFILEGHDIGSYCAFVAGQRSMRVWSTGKYETVFVNIGIISFNFSESDLTISALL